MGLFQTLKRKRAGATIGLIRCYGCGATTDASNIGLDSGVGQVMIPGSAQWWKSTSPFLLGAEDIKMYWCENCWGTMIRALPPPRRPSENTSESLAP